ncbi:uncharacterized protein DSM5745_01283 [Aspergillus mulundensis]|uniref:Uncharacterized protein n=1 Tax=Aspergillus mulundensis TaxID=1810919 RepID=A0A3D8T698_9EURO|nr:hypothetical protein DSM5745_01283 [Aspergillus mulundensis]RDW93961.1 hypothetical protein DSM5745_01283 [Aspergillus mulundensis]
MSLVGNRSNEIQMSNTIHVIRSTTWITPSRLDLMESKQIGPDGKFTASRIDRFTTDPAMYRKIIKAAEERVINGSPIALLAVDTLRANMEKALNHDKRLYEALVPNFPIGCRRLTPGWATLQRGTHQDQCAHGDRAHRADCPRRPGTGNQGGHGLASR